MNLYEVISWGTKEDPNGPDTIYLVRAPDYKAAVDCVALMDNNNTPHHVHEIGIDLSPHAEKTGAKILRGPYFEHAYNYGWKAWDRKSWDANDPDEWEEHPQSFPPRNPPG
jgi:hypothetical protein